MRKEGLNEEKINIFSAMLFEISDLQKGSEKSSFFVCLILK